MNEERSILNVDRKELLEQLDRLLDWIKSCDTKSSIVLAVIGIFLSIFTSQHSLNMLNEILNLSVKNLNFSNFLYLLAFLISWSLFLFGAYCLIRVLIPRLRKFAKDDDETTHKDSIYYFEGISHNTFLEYKHKVFNRDTQDDLNDLLSQIFINSKICTQKYTYYSKGITFTFLGISGVLSLYLVGIVLVKSGGF